MQLNDYFGKVKVKFIDLHNKRGRILFAKIFVQDKHTVIEDKKKEVNMSYRKH